MRLLSLLLLSTLGIWASADEIRCMDKSQQSALIYSLKPLSFRIEAVDGSLTRQILIQGEVTYRTVTDRETVFTYPLENGQSVEMTWAVSALEVLQNIRGRAVEAVLKAQDRAELATYGSCEWVHE